MAKIFTIGHSSHKWNDFISILKDKHVDAIVDVRRYPESRACPQFNKGQMIIELKKENISHIHIEKLGGRRKQSDTKRSRCDDNNSGKTRALEPMRIIWPRHFLEKVSVKYFHL
jgi:uncharacterized protein (DUF488 family)